MTRRIAVVTGGGTGIGRAVALSLAAKGYGLALAGRRAEPLEETVRLVEAAGGEAIAVSADVTDPEAVDRLFQAAVDRFGRVDLLFNNAGMGGPPVLLEELEVDQWLKVVNVNLNGAFYCLRAAFRVMKAQSPQGGRIINNGSISAHAPRPNSIAYTSTKHAITGLTKAASLDGRKYDIACGQIDIGNAATSMGSVMATGVPQANGTIAPEPVMDVGHVGETVAYMDSLPLDANVQFITVMATKMPFVGRG